MIKEVDALLRQWGQERAAPALEASVRSPLGDTDQWLGGGRGSGGEPGLGVAAMFAQYSRVCRVLDDVLRSLSASREEGGLGGRGLTLYTLARVRYVHAGEQPSVAAQLAELAISERTYRTQVAELHRAVLERLEGRLRAADRAAWRVLVGED
ncbi:hypothetical protein HA520_15075 [Azotobacter chroococcum]|uniref:Uncharacterized protein n=1 Tax=Azotobacter chroococcum TaxID=353 RepID=A0AA43Z8F3_9GAMM|nr:hypothetical protein [Azotobacter chroococcum]NHN78585.1 hypothetical protein [Azotobacter chroococcum]